jgi:hypothetical protein
MRAELRSTVGYIAVLFSRSGSSTTERITKYAFADLPDFNSRLLAVEQWPFHYLAVARFGSPSGPMTMITSSGCGFAASTDSDRVRASLGGKTGMPVFKFMYLPPTHPQQGSAA